MDERISRLQERQLLDHADFLGVEYSSLYMCKSKRAMKREESKRVCFFHQQEAYKLPHRLIEKKRRDRINECIGQLKDLLPEHLKLTTLGHLEKAVVLELTLKHLNTLTAVTEQQHQKIVALQSGDRSMKAAIQTDLDAFHSGFQTCAKEVMQYLSRFENWTARDQRCTRLINHLHKVSAQFLPSAPLLSHQPSEGKSAATAQEPDGQKAESQANCVPVIQRTHNGELNENDTDTDSGYGGEAEKYDGKFDKEYKSQGPKSVKIKQEFGDDHPAKKTKIDSTGIGMGSPDLTNRPDVALLNSLMGLGGVSVGQQAPFCMPFYFINPSAAASYMPLFDKSNLEKYFYPGTAAVANPFPLLYPGLPAQAAAAAAFPGLSSALSLDKRCVSAPLSQNSESAPPDFDSSNESCSPAANEDSLDDENPDESPETENGST
ncbi:class E basic helix-loop-helix protein 41 isoform X1 [Anguilla anguilla]|uniref:class E basic helix-loop-helix protein 41 isoform X1 n=1 Tax=Anguilla anguilla TaxID=7936 RepID=UPI0015AE6DFB|nr:class E basic helix-loop-helix protein 41 isoform X1 [Anguilla anguilla]